METDVVEVFTNVLFVVIIVVLGVREVGVVNGVVGVGRRVLEGVVDVGGRV